MQPAPTMVVYRIAMAKCDVKSVCVCVCVCVCVFQMHGNMCNAFFIDLIYFRHYLKKTLAFCTPLYKL